VPLIIVGILDPSLDRTKLIPGGMYFAICTLRFRVLIEQDEDGVFVAEVPALPGCISQGKTRSEVLDNIKEAMVGYLESLEAHGEPIPPSITEEVVEVTL
jgi:predicted RNase H-like HicB family nuclease